MQNSSKRLKKKACFTAMVLKVVVPVLIACMLLSCNINLTGGLQAPVTTTELANSPQPAKAQVLILYDYVDDEWGWAGKVYAMHVANLMGHFSLSCNTRNVADYISGEMETYRATIYLGNYYDNPALGTTFFSDVMTTDKPVIWISYNIWQLAWNPDYDFEGKFGFQFTGHDTGGGFTIFYKGETFSINPDASDIGLTTVINNEKAWVVATASNGKITTPYILKGGNFWYVALPYVGSDENDAYLVFCDVLHDIFGNHAQNHRALVRIEDVNPLSNPEQLVAIADYLYSQDVPFAVAVTPVFTDPLGFYSKEARSQAALSFLKSAPDVKPLSQSPRLVDALKYMVSRGGTIIMHGYTHQYDSVANPYNGVSTTDFEFYRVTGGEEGMPTYVGPVPEDSTEWAQQRISNGINEFNRVDIGVEIFETPHYAASPVDYRVFARNFPATYQRVFYSLEAASRSKETGSTAVKDYMSDKQSPANKSARGIEQFFPYVIQKDVYGQKVLPENLDGIKIESWRGLETRLPKDVILTAKRNLAIRDGWASFYFHSFLDIKYLKQTVAGIKSLGYKFVAPSPELE